jgi:hypothetical protein
MLFTNGKRMYFFHLSGSPAMFVPREKFAPAPVAPVEKPVKSRVLDPWPCPVEGCTPKGGAPDDSPICPRYECPLEKTEAQRAADRAAAVTLIQRNLF